MNNISEFSITRYTSALGQEIDTWRWIPHDARSQPLYRSGYLDDHAPDVAVDFEAQVKNSHVWILGNAVYFDEVDGAKEATQKQKMEILDGFLWIAGSSTFRTPPPDDHQDFHARQLHELPEGHEWTTEDEFLNTLKGALDYHADLTAESDKLEAVKAAVIYEAKAARYRKLGWDDGDILAEFGPHPSSSHRGTLVKR